VKTPWAKPDTAFRGEQQLFPDWPGERFPFYVVYPSRKHLPAKTREFVDFVVSLPSSGAQD
jgi:DNA-binding transcriptional LysR family regulator